jgi:hypothetical protein
MVMSSDQQSPEPIAALASSGSSNASDVQAAMEEFESMLAARLVPGSGAAKLGAAGVARRVVGHLSVTPALQLALYTKLPVSFHQPCYVILIGRGQVRVATYAFVGEPVSGDRPDRKHTPFMLKILTPDLLKGDNMPDKTDEIGFEYTVSRSVYQPRLAAPVCSFTLPSPIRLLCSAGVPERKRLQR